MARAGEILDGKYVLQRKIGQGGMSEVWMAADIRLGKRWAVKEIRRTGNPARDAVMRRHARAEAELIRHLDHPAIPRITDILAQGERLDIVMDLVSGTALDVICRREGWQSEDRVLDWGIQAADILAYLHGRNPPVLYRDMKPANLILGEDGRIRLVDFGAADRGAVSCAATGTPGYAPPEQMAGGRMDVRSDVYSLGAALRWMLDGTLPGASPRKAGRQFTFGKITRKIFRRDLVGDSVIAEDRDDVSFIWYNHYDQEMHLNEIDLSVFIREEEDLYRKYQELHIQAGFTLAGMKELLEESGLEYLAAWDGYSDRPAGEESSRIVFLARERGKEKILR